MTYIRATTNQGGVFLKMADVGAITDSSSGTPDRTISAGAGTYNEAGEDNNRADLADFYNDWRAAARTAELMA